MTDEVKALSEKLLLKQENAHRVMSSEDKEKMGGLRQGLYAVP